MSMFSWFQNLMPQENRFFDLFNHHARTIVDGAEALRSLLHSDTEVKAACKKVFEFETQADVITQDVLLLTRRSFITPFDRSDIKSLITSLDDSIDQMKKTAKSILLFEVETFEPHMAQMGDVIVDAAKLTVEAVAQLQTLRQNSVKVNGVTEAIIRLEESADELNNQGVKALFAKYRNGNAMDYIIGNDIYNHLERVMDRFEDVANGISGIAIEQS
jgi:predicted phosphate transport protein (TIGR00153 family)